MSLFADHISTNKDLFCRLHSADEVVRRHGAAAPVSIVGPRGTMFLADTDGIHKGAVPIRNPRLIFEVGYSLLPVFALRYAPACLTRDHPPLDPYINRLIIAN